MTPFAHTLTTWYRANKRDLPWRATQDPYPVWLSEIILQQTRVAQGLPYWQKFMESFPQVGDLANAPEQEVLRLWQGLGYYSRARNLHAAAKYIHEELDDKFPSTYNEILKLKGVGPYTAAAIASICFDEPTPVVDGNVFRFAARYFGLEIDIASSGARAHFAATLQSHIANRNPGQFNQAMMEYGARVCTPSPNCSACSFSQSCYAFSRNLQRTLPVKSKKVKVKDRNFHYLVFRYGTAYLVRLRGANDVWQGLYDFYLLEGDLGLEEILHETKLLISPLGFTLERNTDGIKHVLTHQRINAKFYELCLHQKPDKSVIQKLGLTLVSDQEIINLPKPQLIVKYLDRYK
ncbi:MAG: A/G-specific adenine glycosylase [Bacteroidota bacterium]